MNHRHAMSTLVGRAFVALALAAALQTQAAAQGNPTGTLSGHVTDAGNLPVPGATVTVSSPVLQGVRTAVTSTNERSADERAHGMSVVHNASQKVTTTVMNDP